MDQEPRLALITGASSGLGEIFARRLAQRGCSPILVARRQERLETLARELAQENQVSPEVLVADLSKSDDLLRVKERIEAAPALEMLINNAVFGTTGSFGEVDMALHLDMIHIQATASACLVRAALPKMIAAGQGAIINVGSLASFVAAPHRVTYSANKAFLLKLSEGLARELEGTGVRVQCLCPGFTYTEFHESPTFEGFERTDVPKGMWMSAEDVVSDSLRALEAGKVVCIPGWKNRLIVNLQRSLVGPIVVRMLSKKR